jgi:TnpA family transposase
MIQAMLSIQARRVMPSMLRRKLDTYSRRSRLYRAFCELSGVERTLSYLRPGKHVGRQQAALRKLAGGAPGRWGSAA